MGNTDTDPRREAVREALEGIHVYGLARRAGVFDPDGTDTPGARFLTGVRDAVVEQLDYTDPDELTPETVRDWPSMDWPHEAADALVPVYTAERWRVFTDLAELLRGRDTWTVDVSDFGPTDDLTTAAGYALYEAARALIAELADDAAEALEGVTDTRE